MTTRYGRTPWQTPGPYLALGLTRPESENLVPEDEPRALRIEGTVVNGAGAGVVTGFVEIWQADFAGRFDSADDPRGSGASGFSGFGRCILDQDGSFRFRTVKPGPLPAEDGLVEAPHIDVMLGTTLPRSLITRIYFPDEWAANAKDPVLSGLSERDRELLIARPSGEGLLIFDLHLQGPHETPFFTF